MDDEGIYWGVRKSGEIIYPSLTAEIPYTSQPIGEVALLHLTQHSN